MAGVDWVGHPHQRRRMGLGHSEEDSRLAKTVVVVGNFADLITIQNMSQHPIEING